MKGQNYIRYNTAVAYNRLELWSSKGELKISMCPRYCSLYITHTHTSYNKYHCAGQIFEFGRYCTWKIMGKSIGFAF